MARLLSYVCRRRVSKQEKQEFLEKLGEVYFGKAIKRGETAHRIAKKTGMNYRWVIKHLPKN